MFPPIKLQSLRYEDDIRSMKKSRMFGIVSRKDKILVPLFPFGDTGYSEIECNHFYQTNMLTEVRNVMQKYQKQVVFCLHPGTKKIEQIANMLQGFRYEIGVFDKYLLEAKLVICTYRGTTCLASAVANNVPTILLKDSGCDKPRRYNNLTICTIGQLNYEMDKSA